MRQLANWTAGADVILLDWASPKPGAVLPGDLADVGAVPPGLFRRIINEEWVGFLDQVLSR